MVRPRTFHGPWACPKCGETNGSSRAAKAVLCKSCVNERAKLWRENNLEHARAGDRRRYARKMMQKRKSKYGITEEQFNSLLEAQGGKCAICQNVLNHRDSGDDYRGREYCLHVDHNHETGIVRGLLCGRCNRGLGFFGDDVELLSAAWVYLLAHDCFPNLIGAGV